MSVLGGGMLSELALVECLFFQASYACVRVGQLRSIDLWSIESQLMHLLGGWVQAGPCLHVGRWHG
jgi:hypothetical protein